MPNIAHLPEAEIDTDVKIFYREVSVVGEQKFSFKGPGAETVTTFLRHNTLLDYLCAQCAGFGYLPRRTHLTTLSRQNVYTQVPMGTTATGIRIKTFRVRSRRRLRRNEYGRNERLCGHDGFSLAIIDSRA